MYFKILKNDMTSIYGDYQYHLGLNTDTNKFDNEACQNGLHFSDEKSILSFCAGNPYYVEEHYPCLIAEVEIPYFEKVVKFDSIYANKYKAHSIIIKNIRPLYTLDTIKYLDSCGVNFNANQFLYNVYKNKYYDIIKYLFDNKCSNNCIERFNNRNTYLQYYMSKNCKDILKYHLTNNHSQELVNYLLDYIIEDYDIEDMRLKVKTYLDSSFSSNDWNYIRSFSARNSIYGCRFKDIIISSIKQS